MKPVFKSSNLIEINRKCHDEFAHLYSNNHDDIFNPIEQQRLKSKLELLSLYISPTAEVLDFGCGSGNLTRHLIELGYYVSSADISAQFLEIVGNKFCKIKKHKAILLTGNSEDDLIGAKYDAICTYSVLHHLPDYVNSVLWLTTKLKPGGLLYIDHEASPSYWDNQAQYSELEKRSKKNKFLNDINKLFRLRWYHTRIKKLFNPKFQAEGDIHVWADDHVRWDLIDMALSGINFSKVHSEDYLVYRKHYRLADFNHFKTKAADMRVSVYRSPVH